MKHEAKTMWVCIVPLAYDIMSLAGDEQTAIKLAAQKAVEFLDESYTLHGPTGERHSPEGVLEYFGSRTYEIKPNTAIVCS